MVTTEDRAEGAGKIREKDYEVKTIRYKIKIRNSLAVQWLEDFTARRKGLVPVWGTKSQEPQGVARKKRYKNVMYKKYS